MSDGFSNYQVEKWLASLNNSYAALHYDDPRTAGAYSSEFFGGAYKRCQVSMTSPDNRAIFNTNDLTWVGLASSTITHIALWDTQINGNLLLSSGLINPDTGLPYQIKVLSGGRYDLGAGEFAVSFA